MSLNSIDTIRTKEKGARLERSDSMFPGIASLRSNARILALAAIIGTGGCNAKDCITALGYDGPSENTRVSMTLLEMDEELKKKEDQKKQFKAFSCTGKEIADGECF